MDAEWHQTNWSVNKAIDFINSRTEFDDPWLYSVNIFDPHHSFDPPRDYLPLPNYFDGELDNKTRIPANRPLGSLRQPQGALASGDVG